MFTLVLFFNNPTTDKLSMLTTGKRHFLSIVLLKMLGIFSVTLLNFILSKFSFLRFSRLFKFLKLSLLLSDEWRDINPNSHIFRIIFRLKNSNILNVMHPIKKLNFHNYLWMQLNINVKLYYISVWRFKLFSSTIFSYIAYTPFILPHVSYSINEKYFALVKRSV